MPADGPPGRAGLLAGLVPRAPAELLRAGRIEVVTHHPADGLPLVATRLYVDGDIRVVVWRHPQAPGGTDRLAALDEALLARHRQALAAKLEGLRALLRLPNRLGVAVGIAGFAYLAQGAPQDAIFLALVQDAGVAGAGALVVQQSLRMLAPPLFRRAVRRLAGAAGR